MLLPILLPLTSGPGKARMDLVCELQDGRYRLYAEEGAERWAVLPPGASPEAETEGLTREQAMTAGFLAGFAKRKVERAIRKAEARGNC